MSDSANSPRRAAGDSPRAGNDDAPSLLVVGESGVFSCALPVRGEVSVGRADDCDVVVDDPSMSRRHLVVRTDGEGAVLVTDLGGPNGTSLGGVRLAPRMPTVVPLGATLTAASTVLVFRTRAQASRAVGLVSHAELRAQLLAECNRAGATLRMGAAFALVRVQAASVRDARAIEEALGSSLRRRDVVAAVTPGTYVALLSETTPARADAVAARVASVLTARGVEAKVHIVLFPRDGDTPELLDGSEGTEPSRARVDPVRSAPALPGAPLEAQIEALAAAMANVVVVGERGAGKEVVARAIHTRSKRGQAPFVYVDCTAPAEPGLLEAARGGSLYLDEIAQMHPTLQAQLAQQIDATSRGREAPSGMRAHDVRFFSATRAEPEAARAALTPPLFHLLDGVRLVVPPLRARVDEIEPLAKAFVRATCASIGRNDEMRIAAPALALLKHHAWPRNVRELKDVMERAVLLARDVITLDHLPCEALAPVVSVRRVERS